MHNEELMLELALNKSKGIGVGNSTLDQQVINPATTYEYIPATMAPPPPVMSTTYSNALPTTLTADITSMRKGKQPCCNQ